MIPTQGAPRHRPRWPFRLRLANGVGNPFVMEGRTRRDRVPIFAEQVEDDLRASNDKQENVPWSVMVLFAFHVAIMDPVYIKRRIPAA